VGQKEGVSFWEDFRKFAVRGNAIDLAVGGTIYKFYFRVFRPNNNSTKPVILLFILFNAVFPLTSFGADPVPLPSESSSMEGSWVGRLSEKIGNLKVVIHIKTPASGPTATLDSPDQGGYGIQVSKISVEGNQLSFRIEPLDVTYQGKMDPSRKEIQGVFVQRGLSSDLVLRPLASLTSQIPSELAFQYSTLAPKDLRPSSGEGECRIHLINGTTDYLCLAQIDGDGNLRHGWSDGKPGQPVFYVAPGGRTAGDRPYLFTTGTPFLVLTLNGKIVGHGKPSKAGQYDLKLE